MSALRPRSRPLRLATLARVLGPSLLLAGLSGCAHVPREPGPPASASVTLSIVGTNDLHGGIAARDDGGGLALLGGYLRNLREARRSDGGAVLLIDAGDIFHGTLESNLNEGAVVVDAYNALGYTAAAVGNHEFDFGPAGPSTTPESPAENPRGALKARAAEARFPFLAANLLDERTGRPVEWPNVRPSVLIERAGVPVGIIGVMTSTALSATIRANVTGLQVAPLAPAIEAEAVRLRAAGARIVIVSAHAGATCTAFEDPTDLSSCNESGEILQVARSLPPSLVDVIVAGHIHAGIAHVVGGTAVIASYANGRAFGRVDVTVDRAHGTVRGRTIHPPQWVCRGVRAGSASCAPPGAPDAFPPEYENRVVTTDPAIEAVLAPAVSKAARMKAEPVGAVLETPVRRLGRGDSPLGNLFTDALLHAVPGADVALHNISGGLRADLPAGPLTYGDVYEMMPFDNRIVSLRLTGAALKTVFARHLQRTSRILGVSGVRVRAGCREGGIDIALVRPSGALVADDEQLVVVMGDFLATGGDGILTPVMPAEGIVVPQDAPLARDVFAAYLRRLGRGVREEHLVEADNPRTAYPGTLPLTCG